MKVLVTVKEVAEVADDFEIAGTEIDETYLEYDLNEWDDYAVEEAVQLQEAGIADEVVAVTIGPERAEETIRMALAKGADRGPHLGRRTGGRGPARRGREDRHPREGRRGGGPRPRPLRRAGRRRRLRRDRCLAGRRARLRVGRGREPPRPGL